MLPIPGPIRYDTGFSRGERAGLAVIKRGIFTSPVQLRLFLNGWQPKFAVTEIASKAPVLLQPDEWIFGDNLLELLDQTLQWTENESQVNFVPPTEEDKWAWGDDHGGSWQVTGPVGKYLDEYTDFFWQIEGTLEAVIPPSQSAYKKIVLDQLAVADSSLCIMDGFAALDEYLDEWVNDDMVSWNCPQDQADELPDDLGAGSGVLAMEMAARKEFFEPIEKDLKPSEPVSITRDFPSQWHSLYNVEDVMQSLFPSSGQTQVVAKGFLDENGDGRILSFSSPQQLLEVHGRVWRYLITQVSEHGVRKSDFSANFLVNDLRQACDISKKDVFSVLQGLRQVEVTEARTKGTWINEFSCASLISSLAYNDHVARISFPGDVLGLFALGLAAVWETKTTPGKP